MSDPVVVETDFTGPERVRTRQDFARELTLLREQIGLTVRQVAAEIGALSAHSTIGDWFSGRGLPSPTSRDQLVRVLAVCGVEDADVVEQWLQAWRRVRRLPGRRASGPEPYRGLASFQPEDVDWFFGRDDLTSQFVTRLAELRAVGGGIQVVVGASGSGKSSLLRAGMIPALRAGRLPGSAAWPLVLFTPGPRPLDALAVELARCTDSSADEIAEAMWADPGHGARYVRSTSVANGSIGDIPDGGEQPDSAGRPADSCPLVVVVDQFEEVFTACDEEERRAFIAALCAVGSGGALVVLGLRADFYAQLLRYPQLVAAVQAGQLTVGPMRRAQLRAAIVEPARKAKLEIEDGLVELLLRDIAPQGGIDERAHDAGALPLLSHALYATWSQGQGRRLTIADYRKVGGIDGAVAASASKVYDQLTASEQELARRLFLNLVHVAPDTADTRRRAATSNLFSNYDNNPVEQLEEVLDRFVAERLITADLDTVEISHEALLTAWPRLREWLDADRTSLVIGRRLDEAAVTWCREHRDPAALYRGTRLAAVQDWISEDLTPLAREFLDASIQRELDEQRAARHRTRRLRQLVAGLSVLLVTTMVTAVVAVRSQQTASEQRNTAISRKVGNDAAALRITNPALAAQLSLAAYRLSPTVEARSSLLSTFGIPYATRLIGHTDYVGAVRFSPDGRTLVTGSRDRAARLWDVTDPHRPRQISVLAGHRDGVVVAFGPDGHTVVTVDGALRLWDITDPRHPTTVATVSGDLNLRSVAFSPDGHTLATGGLDGTVRLWNVVDPAHPRELAAVTGHSDAVYSVAFSPDGYTLATGGLDSTVRLWDLADHQHPTRLAVLAAHSDNTSARFSPDGRTLATASADRTVRLWDLTDRQHPTTVAVLTGHTDLVYAAEFSPDGHTLATASADNTLRIWDITDRQKPYERTVLTSHTGGIDTNSISAVAFSPDGRTLASASFDHTARLWDLPGPVLTGCTGLVRPVAFSSDGRTLITQGDHAARSWDITDSHHPVMRATLVGATDMACGKGGEVTSVASSSDGQTLATGGADGGLRLWNVTGPRRATPLAALARPGGPVEGVVFSPSSPVLASKNRDGIIRIWDIADPRRLRESATLTDHTGPVNTLVFSPDGRILASTSYDRTVRLWDVTDPYHPPLLAMLTAFNNAVYSVAFRPDGRVLATTGQDPAVRLWNVADPRRPAELATLTGHTASVNEVIFSPNGGTLVTGGYDHAVRLWDVSIDRIARRVCDQAYPTITPTEWDRYFPDLAYRPPCR